MNYTEIAGLLSQLSTQANQMKAIADKAEEGELFGEPLSNEIITGLEAKLEVEYDNLKDIMALLDNKF